MAIDPVDRSSRAWTGVATAQQLLGQVRADEPCSPCDQNVHMTNPGPGDTLSVMSAPRARRESNPRYAKPCPSARRTVWCLDLGGCMQRNRQAASHRRTPEHRVVVALTGMDEDCALTGRPARRRATGASFIKLVRVPTTARMRRCRLVSATRLRLPSVAHQANRAPAPTATGSLAKVTLMASAREPRT